MLRKTTHLIICASTAFACGSDDSTSEPTPETPTDPTNPVSSRVRVAHLSPDAAAVDFCFVPSEGAIVGPVLAGAGLTNGVSFGNVTPYLPVTDGVYTIRIIAAGAADCNEAVAEVPNVAVPGGGFDVTAIAFGFFASGQSPGFELGFFIDDNTASEKAKLRIIHASPDAPNINAGVLPEDQSTLTPNDFLFENLAYKLASSPAYAEVDTTDAATLRIQSVDQPNTGRELRNLFLPAGAAMTVFAIGTFDQLELFVCPDNQGDGACQIE